MAAAASEGSGAVSSETPINQGSDERDNYQATIESYLKPLEPRWNFIRDVLLWKKPVISLCVFMVVNSIFSYFSSGHFRIFLIVSALMAFALCMDEIRGRATRILERAGITPEERLSYETSLTFNRFCYKLAFMYDILMLQCSRLKELKTTSTKKYYGVVALLFLTAVFTYQYCPLLKLTYCTWILLYLWTPIKYHGTHYVMYGVVEPFIRPFVTQWKHSRTKRERSQAFKGTKGDEHAEDSDEEFAKAFHPKADAKDKPKPVKQPVEPVIPAEPVMPAVDVTDGQHISKQPRIPPADVLLEPVVSSGSSDQQSPPTTLPLDETLIPLPPDESCSDTTEIASLTSLDLAPSTPGGSSVSYESLGSFLPDSQQLPSLSQDTLSLDFDEDDFTQGLEFPDIEGKEYHSSNESLNEAGSSQNRTDKTDAVQRRGQKNSSRGVKRKGPSMTSSPQPSPSSDVASEFEFLDRSEVDEIDSARDEDRSSSPGALGNVTSYVGKWFGYNQQ